MYLDHDYDYCFPPKDDTSKILGSAKFIQMQNKRNSEKKLTSHTTDSNNEFKLIQASA